MYWMYTCLDVIFTEVTEHFYCILDASTIRIDPIETIFDVRVFKVQIQTALGWRVLGTLG